jgi:cytochrome P450
MFSLHSTRCAVTLPIFTPLPNSPETNVLHLPKDTTVIIGIAAANRDPLIWGTDAVEWKPERWVGKRVDEVAGERLPGIYSGM